jgi:5-methylcytosine-specific restriction endonuclease McrA
MDRAEQIFKRYERQAKRRKLPWRIDLQTFTKLIGGRCSYCGQFGDSEHGGYNTVDRIDNRIGYLVSPICNVTTACIECNFARRIMTPDSFVRMCERVAKYQQELRDKKNKKQEAA